MTTQTTPRVLDLTPMTGTNLKEHLALPDGIVLLEHDQEPDPESGVFRILNPSSGDDRLTWDKRDFRAMQDARQTYIDLVKKGFKPFRVDATGKQTTEAMQEFDPLAQQVIFVPMRPVMGG